MLYIKVNDMKKLQLCICFLLTILLMTGCLYPEERLKQNQIPYENQLESVQSAVDQFAKDNNGLLPIKNRDAKTPIYQKYPIDFNKLIPRYIQEPPGNAFESGGIFLYVIVDPETKPTVKLIDLRMAETIRDLQVRLNVYRQKNKYPPFKEVIADKVFNIDFKKLGYKEPPYVISPFSGKNLPLVITNKGEIFVDYRMDLYEALKKHKHSYKPGEDIRGILVKNSMFVPAFSLPYTIDENNEPTFLME
jgi:hypothetical protein